MKYLYVLTVIVSAGIQNSHAARAGGTGSFAACCEGRVEASSDMCKGIDWSSCPKSASLSADTVSSGARFTRPKIIESISKTEKLSP